MSRKSPVKIAFLCKNVAAGRTSAASFCPQYNNNNNTYVHAGHSNALHTHDEPGDEEDLRPSLSVHFGT